MRHGGTELFNSVAIVARIDRKQALESVKKLQAYLERKKVPVSLEQKLAKRTKRSETAVPLEKMKVDLVIARAKSEYESSFIRFEGPFYRRLKGRLLFSRGEPT